MASRRYRRSRGIKRYRRYRRRYGRRRVKGIRRRFGRIQPTRKRVRLVYNELVSINPDNTGLISSHVFRANDLYDPNYTASGHQPMGFDELCAMYNHFTVVGSKIDVTVCPVSAAISGQWGVGLFDNATATSAVAADQLLECGRAGMMPRIASYETRNYSSHCRRKFSLRRFFNTRDVFSDKFQCNASASPLEQAYYHLWYSSVGNNDPGNLNFNVHIEYLVYCHEPKMMDQS